MERSAPDRSLSVYDRDTLLAGKGPLTPTPVHVPMVEDVVAYDFSSF